MVHFRYKIFSFFTALFCLLSVVSFGAQGGQEVEEASEEIRGVLQARLASTKDSLESGEFFLREINSANTERLNELCVQAYGEIHQKGSDIERKKCLYQNHEAYIQCLKGEVGEYDLLLKKLDEGHNASDIMFLTKSFFTRIFCNFKKDIPNRYLLLKKCEFNIKNLALPPASELNQELIDIFLSGAEMMKISARIVPSKKEIQDIFSKIIRKDKQYEAVRDFFTVLEAYVLDLVEHPPYPDHWMGRQVRENLLPKASSEVAGIHSSRRMVDLLRAQKGEVLYQKALTLLKGPTEDWEQREAH